MVGAAGPEGMGGGPRAGPDAGCRWRLGQRSARRPQEALPGLDPLPTLLLELVEQATPISCGQWALAPGELVSVLAPHHRVALETQRTGADDVDLFFLRPTPHGHYVAPVVSLSREDPI